MSITKKIMIKEKYLEFIKFLKHNDFEEEISLFPSIDDIDVTDLTYFITITFLGLKDDEELKDKIVEISELQGIDLDDEKVEFLVPYLRDFLNWLRSV